MGSELSDSTGKHTQTQIQAKPVDLTVAWKELEDLPEILSAADLDKWQGIKGNETVSEEPVGIWIPQHKTSFKSLSVQVPGDQYTPIILCVSVKQDSVTVSEGSTSSLKKKRAEDSVYSWDLQGFRR